MSVNVGDVVSIRHYSGDNLFKGLVAESNFDVLKVKMSENISELKFCAGDPMVVGYESEDLVYISSCNLVTVNNEENKITLLTDTFETLTNKRLFERFPVSFNVNFKIGSSKADYPSIAKNISFNGMLICSKHEFPLYQEVKVEIDVLNKISIKGIIIRKEKTPHNFEYGMKLVYTDPQAPVVLKKYLMQLKKEQEDFVALFKQKIKS